MTMRERKIKTGTLYRDLALDRANIDKDERTVAISFSSEAPVERWFGTEILDHSPKAVRLKRIQDGGPLLMDHRATDQVGVIQEVEIGKDRVGRAVVRFGRGARAEEIFQDVLDGVRSKISVGYLIHRMEVENPKSDNPTYRATDWEPLEISLVAIPADVSVGVGRAAESDGAHEITILERTLEMPNEQQTASPAAENAAHAAAVAAARTEAANQARAAELARVAEITKIGRQFADYGATEVADRYIAEGKSAEDFQRHVIGILAEKKPVPSADVGLSEREIKSFSFVRAIRALAYAGKPEGRKFWEEAAFEREVSAAAAKKSGKTAQGILVAPDVLRAPMMGLDGGDSGEIVRAMLAKLLTRDLVKGTTTAGGHTVSTDLLGASFIDLLRNRMALQRLGVTMLNGLVGDIAIPRQTGGATAYWVAESGAPDESQQTFDQVTMSPKTLGAYTDFSRKLMLQSSIDVESFVRTDLTRVIGLALDLAGLYGTGSDNQPRGVKNQSGINTKDFDAAAPTWAEIVDLETKVAADNADFGTLAYLVNATGRGSLKTTDKASGAAQFIWAPDNTVNGYRAEVSNQVASGDYWFGNWADLVLGMWSGLDLMVDPYAGATSGTMRVIALQDCDIAVRHPESFTRGNNTL